MTNCQSDIPTPFGAAIEQQSGVDQKQPQLPSKGIRGISGLTAGLVGTALVLSGCAQLKPSPAHCHCNPSPSKHSSCDVPDKKSKEKFLKIALRLHKIHTEAIELASKLDLFERTGDENEEGKPKIKGKLMNLLLLVKKYKKMVLKNTELNSRIILVEDYLKRRIQDHFGN
jgi:hypothetical protein